MRISPETRLNGDRSRHYLRRDATRHDKSPMAFTQEEELFAEAASRASQDGLLGGMTKSINARADVA